MPNSWNLFDEIREGFEACRDQPSELCQRKLSAPSEGRSRAVRTVANGSCHPRRTNAPERSARQVDGPARPGGSGQIMKT